MKVQINVKISSNDEASTKLELVVGTTDTVLNVKDRVAAVQLIPFPEQDLLLDGEVLEDGKQLVDCGVKEKSSLDLVVKASEASLVRQLSELLQARDLSCDELGLLYCYKHGVSVSQALKTIGQCEKLQDFLKKQKAFQLENSNVALVREDTALKPFSVASEVEQILKAGSGTMDIKELCSKFVQKFNISLSSIVGMKPADFLAKEKDLFVLTGRGQVSLKSATPPPAAEKKPSRGNRGEKEVQVPAAPGLLRPARAEQPMEAPPGLEMPDEVAVLESADSQQYLDLHSKICGRSFNSKVMQTLSEIVEVLHETSFLNIHKVAKGGSVGKGTAISGFTDAEIVLFLKGLPANGQDKWLPSLLRAVSGVLVENLGEHRGLEAIKQTEDSVQMRVKGIFLLDVRLSPVFESYAKTIQALGVQGPEARRFYNPSLVEERVQFIARQPGQVKVTIRLLKWWRDQQEWSGKLVRPTDDILELMAVYSAVQTKPSDQRKAIANVMSLLSRFDELRIVWSNFYTKDDVWSPLMRQRPLLMDPVNPFVNIADPQSFDARELMAAAASTHFFW